MNLKACAIIGEDGRSKMEADRWLLLILVVKVS